MNRQAHLWQCRSPGGQDDCKVAQMLGPLVLSLSKDGQSESVHGSTLRQAQGSPPTDSQRLCNRPAWRRIQRCRIFLETTAADLEKRALRPANCCRFQGPRPRGDGRMKRRYTLPGRTGILSQCSPSTAWRTPRAAVRCQWLGQDTDSRLPRSPRWPEELQRGRRQALLQRSCRHR